VGFVRSIATGVVATDRALLTLTPAIRVAVVITITMGLSLPTHLTAFATNAAIGMLFVGLADPGGSYLTRSRTLFGSVVLMTAAVSLGCILADHPLLHLVMVTIWAFGAGLLCALGPRGAAAGVFSLVLILIYSGTAIPLQVGGRTVAAVAAGEVLMLIAIMAPWLWRRAAGSRAQFAVFFRGESVALRQGPRSMASADHIERLRSVDVGLDNDQHTGAAKAWFEQLVETSHTFRTAVLAFAGLLSQTQESSTLEGMLVVRRVLAEASCAVARTLVWPQRNRNLSNVRSRLQGAVEALRPNVSSREMTIVDAAVGSMSQIVALLATPWPLGRRNGVRLRWIGSLGHFSWRPHLRWSDPSFRHGTRLAVAIAIAVGCTDLLPFSHDYWVALTVAWIAKPGVGDTFLRVASRMVGTAVGAAATLVVFVVLHPSPTVWLFVLGMTAMISVLFMAPNYSLCIAAITMFVLVMFGLNQASLASTVPSRLIATLAGGVIVLAAAQLWPIKEGGGICGALTEVALAIDVLIERAITHGGLELVDTPEAEHVREARVRATHVVAAVAHEPGRHRLSHGDATELLATLTDLTTKLMEYSVLGVDDAARSSLREVQGELRRTVFDLELLSGSPRLRAD